MRKKLLEREVHYAEQRINQLDARIRGLGGTVSGETDG